MKYLVNLMLICILFFSCSNNCYQKQDLRIRVSLESLDSDRVEIRVFAENQDGNAITGAFVSLKSSQNQFKRIYFDTNEWCYKTELTVLNNEIFTIYVDSVLLTEIMEINVPYSRIETPPTITNITDELGNSIFTGNTLSAEKNIQISWELQEEDVIYYVRIKDSFSSIVRETSTEEKSIIIPANTLKNGKYYYVYVQAQKILGDIQYKDEMYYSVFTNESSQVEFRVD